ncbi:hypothetical protein AWR36_006055 [Microbulbifer flavimaris]|uniref:Transposase n=1 Tax=Microbulbifer flavimaris TaxID=1781068 RepID=A0ABX4HZJ8_9GAMM|nr:hypothetical protein AVO43_06040 [Microbulbifer sp. ZGT114]PCO05577.1 hypothetical protein AWR36_006055 [Microbulbifer flavimaris]
MKMQAQVRHVTRLQAKSISSAIYIVSRYLTVLFTTKRQMHAIACLLVRGHDGHELREILDTKRPGAVIAQLRKRGLKIPSTSTFTYGKHGWLWRKVYKFSSEDRQTLAELVHLSKKKQGGKN